MLILSRHENESIRIGDDIRITIVRIERGKVRIGINAPRDIRVDREELPPHPAGPRPGDAA